MVRVVIVYLFVFLCLTVKQARTEYCPSNCTCLSKSGAECKDLLIDGIIPEEEKIKTNVTKLHFSGNKIGLLNGSIFSKWSKYYPQFINLSGNNIVEVEKFAFSGFSELEDLDLSRNNISGIDSTAFSTNPKLVSLWLTNNSLTEIHNSTFSNLENLRNLNLSNNIISSIEPETFHNNDNLESLCLANNRLTIIDPDTFQKQSNLSYLDLSGNKIRQIEGRIFYNNTKLKSLLLANNEIYSFNFKEYLPLSITHNISVKYFELELLDLSGNCLSALDDTSVNLLRNSTAFVDLTDNPWFCDCSSSKSVYQILSDNITLNCATPEHLKGKICPDLKDPCHSVTSTSETVSSLDHETQVGSTEDGENEKIENMTRSGPLLRANVVIFGIYASTICAVIIVVLIITRAVGKPEPDEFWWEDKLAKRNS